jgi:hypothetical protein
LVTYDRTTNQYELSTGRRFYANAGIIGISPNHDHDAPIPHGYDGSVVIDGSLAYGEYDNAQEERDLSPWTEAERIELADEMIRRWTAFKQIPMNDPTVADRAGHR